MNKQRKCKNQQHKNDKTLDEESQCDPHDYSLSSVSTQPADSNLGSSIVLKEDYTISTRSGHESMQYHINRIWNIHSQNSI